MFFSGRSYSNGLSHAPEGRTLRQWLWSAYARTAIVPLLCVELTFLVVFWVSSMVIYRQQSEQLGQIAQAYFGDMVTREASSQSNRLLSVLQGVELLSRQASLALAEQAPPPRDADRYRMTQDGAIYTHFDNGTTASYYSGIFPVGAGERQKMWRLGRLAPLMMDLKQVHPLVSSVYVNTPDGYNLIYPYIDVLKQYPAKMDMRRYNFFYEADAAHNPAQSPVWTDAYVDPAGRGWMVSAIAPVWHKGKLEAVAGLDVTLDSMLERLRTVALPLDAYALLIDRKGGIIAASERAERVLGLHNQTQHRYDKVIVRDAFRTGSTNLAARPDTRALAKAILQSENGQLKIALGGTQSLVHFAKINGPGWILLVAAPQTSVLASANALRHRLNTIMAVLAGALILFYIAFFAFLFLRARAMAASMSAPLARLVTQIEELEEGVYQQTFTSSHVSEIDRLAHRLVHLSAALADAHTRISEQQRELTSALTATQSHSAERERMISVLSHELRTPLAIIDSGAQILDRKADAIPPAELRRRAAKVRDAVRRMSAILSKLANTSQSDAPIRSEGVVPLDKMLSVAMGALPDEGRISLDVASEAEGILVSQCISEVLRTVLDNALRYTAAATRVGVRIWLNGPVVAIKVTDEGPGITADDMKQVGQRFFRGSNATTTEGAGTGLFDAQRIISELGGELSIRSSVQGTTALLIVPTNTHLPAGQ